MKIGKRLLALVLVLAMMLSNLPMGAIAAEIQELTAEAAETLTEIQQPTEAAPAETEAPETTEAETTGAVTEAAEETTEEVTEEVTEAATEEATEAATEEVTEAATEEATEAAAEEATEAATEEATEAATEPAEAEELAASEEAAMESGNLPYLVYRWLTTDENDVWYEPSDWGDMTYIDMLPTNPFWVIFYAVEWDPDAEEWTYTPVALEDLEYDTDDMTISYMEMPVSGDHAEYYLQVTPNPDAWEHDSVISHTLADESIIYLDCSLGLSPGEFYSSGTEFSRDTVITTVTIAPNGENVYWYYFDVDQGWEHLSAEVVNNADKVTVEQQDGINLMKFTLKQEAVEEIQANGQLQITLDSQVRHEELGERTWTTNLYLYAGQVADQTGPYLSWSPVYENEDGLWVNSEENHTDMVNPWGMTTRAVFWLNEYDEEAGEWNRTQVQVDTPSEDLFVIINTVQEAIEGADFYQTVDSGESNATGNAVYESDAYGQLTLPIGTWPHHFHFSTEASSNPCSKGLIYELDLDHLDYNDTEEIYAVMFHEDFAWTDVRLSEHSQRFAEIEPVDGVANVYRITISGKARSCLFDGENYVNLEVLSTQTDKDGNVNEQGYMYIPIYMEPGEGLQEEGLFAYWLNNDGDGWYVDGEPFHGTNIAKFDEYFLYFFLNIWNEDTGSFEEIPVKPTCDKGITLRSLQTGTNYYGVSVTQYDTEMTVSAKYGGKTYTMPISSYLHEFAPYTTQEPSHDSRVMGPVEIDPFSKYNSVYFAFVSGEWTATNAYLPDWCADLAVVKKVACDYDNAAVWQVTLTEDGIERVMSDYLTHVQLIVDIKNNGDSNWTETRNAEVDFSRMELQSKGMFFLNGENYEILDEGYFHSWFTGEYDSDEEGNTWEVWANELVDELPEGLHYDYTTNTLTMDNYYGQWMSFEYAYFDWESGETVYSLPSDTLTVELIGDSLLNAQNHHAFETHGGLNVVFTGNGSLEIKTTNDYGFEDDYARVWNTMELNGALTVEGNAEVRAIAAGEGNEAAWAGDLYVGDQPGRIFAIMMHGNDVVIRDNGCLITELPEGASRNGEWRPEEDRINGNETPGGYEGICDLGRLHIFGGALHTQHLNIGRWDENDNPVYVPDALVMTDGELVIDAQSWNGINDEGSLHYHYEGLRIEARSTASISGGQVTVWLNVADEHMGSSNWYHAVSVCGGKLNISGDAVVELMANSENGELLKVDCEWGENGPVAVGELNISGGTLNVNGTSGEGNGRMGIYLEHETVFTMSGGTVNSEYADFINHGPAHITGGTINIGGLYWYESEDMKDDRGVPGAWVTGFIAGGPEFTIDGGTININGGHFVADGMVGMNGGEINIVNGSLEVNTAFALNDGVVNISNPGSEISEYNGEPAHIWPALWVNTYFSIGGSDIGNAAPALNITDHQIPSMAVRVDGTYHQMAGSTVNLIYGGTENPGIYVATQFDEYDQPLYATDEDGNLVCDEEGNPIILSGSFLMNDGVLNVINPGDFDAELNNAMQVDYASFAQFRGGKTSFNTAKLFWNGEVHITENAVVEVKDALILANAGHLVMDDGTLLANEESAIWLGNAEMNGGKMELDNAMIEVNSGFHFNNGEIIINNTDETIDPEAIYTSLAANTYFAIGNPEDPDSNPKLTINHNLTNPAVIVNGTMHLMTGTVEINTPTVTDPAIYVEGPIYDENDNPLKTDDEGNPLGGEFRQNGGQLTVNAMDGADVFGILTGADSVFFMNGGTADLNGANFILRGNMFLYDKAVLNVTDAIAELWEGAYAEIDYGVLNLNTAKLTREGAPAALYSAASTHIQLNNGAINVTSKNYDTAMEIHGTFNQDGGEINLKAPWTGMKVYDTANINGGYMNIDVEGKIMEDGVLNAYGLVAELDHNPDAKLTISGGQQIITVPDGGQHDTICHALNSGVMPIEITGGAQYLEGQYVYFGVSEDGTPRLRLADDRVLYSLEDGSKPELLTYPMDGFSFEMYEDDNIPGDWDTGAGFNFLSRAAIVGTGAGAHTTWNVEGGVLTFESSDATASTGSYTAEQPAPWFWLSDVIHVVQIDANMRSIGSYALAGLTSLSKIEFLGNAPSFGVNAFAGTTATAYYPAEESGWTASVKKDYGGSIKWLPRSEEETAEVVAVSADQDVLFSGGKATLTAELYPSKTATVVWELRGGDEAYATLSVKKNVATVTAKAVTETHVITVLARAKDGKTQPMETTLTIYPKAQSVSIFRDGEPVTGKKIKFDLNDVDLELSASLNPNDAEEYLAAPVKWSSSSTKIATVDENGVVSFKKAGTVKITATANDGSKKKATVSITAVDMVQEIEIAANSVTELVGGAAATYVAYDAESGSKLKSGVTWSVAPEFAPYASITSKGKLSTKAVQEEVTITIVAALTDDPEVYDTIDVTIRPAAVLLQILDEEDMVVNGGIVYVNTDGYDDKENPPSISLSTIAYPEEAFTNVTWKTSSKSVAVVNDGLVTGVWKSKAFKTGTVTITATDVNTKKTASVKLVFGVPAEEVMITSDYDQITSGKKLTLTAQVTQPEKPTNAGITWKLKNPADKAYLTITAAGKVTAKTVYAPTPVELIAASKDGCASAEMTLTVMPKDMNVLLISDGEKYVNKTTRTVDLNKEESVTLYARNLDGGDEDVTWFANGGELPVNEDGSLTFTMTNTGKVTVTAKHEDGRTAYVILNYVKLTEKVEITAAGNTLAAGKTMTLTAKLTNAPKKTAVTWSVEPAGLASVTAKGKLTASASITHAQPITVTATANDGSGTFGEIEIMLQPQVRGIQLFGDGIENAANELTNCTVVHNMAQEDGKTIQLSARTFPDAAAGEVTWKSSNTKVATVDQNGVVTCLKAGTVTIAATAKDGSGKSASFKLTLVQLASDVVLNQPEEIILAGGKSLTLKATAVDATNKNVVWSMEGDTTYATLSTKGVLKTSAVTAPKTVYITATAQDGSGCSDTCAVTIYPATSSVQILHDGDAVTSKTTISLEEDKELILDVSSLPISAAGVYKWSISGSVATVTELEDGTVKITGVKASSKAVTLTCAAADGSGKKATVKIKVVPMAEA